MKLNRIVGALVAVVLLAPAVFAAEDLTGKWSGSFNISINGGDPRDDAAFMVLKQTGTTLTGSAGPSEGEQWPIAKGTITVTKVGDKESTKASFDVQPDGGSGPALHFELELIEGRLKGNAKAEQNGMAMTAVLDLARVK